MVKSSEAIAMVPTETIAGAKELVKIYMERDIPPYVEGPPGVGKSDIFAQVAAEAKIGFIDIRLAQLDPVDLRGLPTVDGGLTRWLKAEFWPDPKRDGEKGIILFDEIADCSKAMQSAAYRIILNRQNLPKGWFPCAAGNSQRHKAGAQSMSTALANRFACITVEADHKAWLDYAGEKGIHHLVRAFIQMRPNLLHTLDTAVGKAFASPRSWFQASKVMDLDEKTRIRALRALVGNEVAVEFETVFMRSITLPDLEDILANPQRCEIPDEPSSKYALSAMLANEATRDTLGKIGQYISRSEFGKDFEIVTMLDGTRRDPSLCETKAFVDFAKRNQNLRL